MRNRFHKKKPESGFPGTAWHYFWVGINDKQRFSLYLVFWPHESLTSNEKHRFLLHFENQWQIMTHLNLAFRLGRPMISSIWVSANARPAPPLILTLEKTLCQILLDGRYGWEKKKSELDLLVELKTFSVII